MPVGWLSRLRRSVLVGPDAPPPGKMRLYETAGCYYCARVREAAAILKVPYESVDVNLHPERRKFLVEQLGRGTVPVLEIQSSDGVHLLPESWDIIRYFKTHFGSIGPSGAGLRDQTWPAR